MNYFDVKRDDLDIIATQIYEFTVQFDIDPSDAKSMSALKTKLNYLTPKPLESEFRVLLFLLQNHFYCLKFSKKIRILSNSVATTAAGLIHTKQTEIDTFLTEFHLNERIYASKTDMDDAIIRLFPRVVDRELKAIYQIYEKYLPHMKIKNALNNLNAKIAENDVIIKHKDLFKEFIDILEIPITSNHQEFSDFETFLRTKDNNYAGHSSLYRTIHQKYWEYMQKAKIVNERDKFLTLITSNKPNTDPALEVAFENYMVLIGNPIESFFNLIKIKNEEELYTFLSKEDVFITKALVTLIYPSYSNLYLKRRRNFIKLELRKIDPSRCKNPTYLNKMKEFIHLNGDPQIAKNKVELFNIFSKIDSTFVVDDANKIFECYEAYYQLMDKRESKKKLLKKLEYPSILPVDYHNEMKDFLEKYGLDTHSKYDNVNAMVSRAQIIDPVYVIDGETRKIFEKYRDYIGFLNLRNVRTRILEKLKTNQKNPWDLDSLIVDLKSAYAIGQTRLDIDSFHNTLNNNDKVADDEINILYTAYYDNHEHRIKLDAIWSIKKRINGFSSTTRVEDYRNDMNQFAKKLHIHFNEAPSKINFRQHIENQVGTSLKEEIESIYDSYIKYLDYEKSVDAFEELINKLNKYNNEFSKMRTEFDEFISLFKLTGIQDKTRIDIENIIKLSIRNPDTTKLNKILDNIHKYYLYKSIQPYREALYNYIMENPNPNSQGIKNDLNNLILKYRLNSQDIQTVAKFHELLSGIDDEIKLEESKIFYKYYRKFKIMWNKQSIRDDLFNFLQQGNKFPANRLSIYYMMFIDAYGVGTNTFKNENEFKSFLEQQDDTVNDRHVDVIYEPLSIYLAYLERKRKEENLYKFLISRTDNVGYELSEYIKNYYNSYRLSYDIIIDKPILESHIKVLDGSLEQTKVDKIYPEIVKYSTKMDKLNIVFAVYEFIKQNPRYSMPQISPYFEIFSHFFNVNENTLKLEIFSEKVKDIEGIKKDIISVLYSHFLKFMWYKKFMIAKKLLISQIKRNPEMSFEEITEYITPYIQKLQLPYEELLNYDDFSRKNIQIDGSVSKSDIDLLHKILKIYITSSKYTQKDLFAKAEEKKTSTEETPIFYKKPEKGAAYFWFNFMSGIRITPKQVNYSHELADLTYYQQIFNDLYKSLTKIDYYYFRSKDERPEMEQRLTS